MKRTLKRLAKRIGLRPSAAARNVFRRSGDAARDARDWAQAAAFYARHLERNPKDFGIWVQRGHMLKELEQWAEADAAYSTAARLDENNADLHLHRGHLAKLRGDLDRARAYFYLSYAADNNVLAAEELIRHGEGDIAIEEEDDAGVLNPRFYWELYLSDSPFNEETVRAHYDESANRPNIYANLNELLAAHDMAPGPWIELFSAREFSLLNYHWLGVMLNRAQALARFLDEGVDRLAPIAFSQRFDLDFYREAHPEARHRPDAELYRSWLTDGLRKGVAGSPEAWLRAHDLDLLDYPSGFIWESYAQTHLSSLEPALRGRWQALAHLLAHPEIPASAWPVRKDGAVAFLDAVGLAHDRHGRLDAAIAAYERALAFNGTTHPDALLKLADARHKQKKWPEAAALYGAYHHTGAMTLWSVCLAADSLSRAGDAIAAVDTLKAGRERFAGEQPWLRILEDVVQTHFDRESGRARLLYSVDQRSEGDAIMVAVVKWLTETWAALLDLPAPAAPAAVNGPVVTLGTTALRQCTHYRIDQKSMLFDHLEREHSYFEYTDVDDFLAALPGASAAIFYRIPALPGVVKAILSARSQGIPTYYEIDDLVFDPETYPDPIETFEGQIDESVYQGLIYGTTLYRSAMAMCDYGIASTSPLAHAMERVIGEGRCFIVRNGLDSRNLGLEELPTTPVREPDSLRVFYGSATLSHNQDFNDYAGPALTALLDRNEKAELFIVGHLKLSEQFDRFSDRITRIPLVADSASYWRLLATSDINLAVLAPSPMSDAKSEIKWLEAAVVGVPSIVSATATYREVVDHGRTGLIAATPQDWTEELGRLASDADLRRRIATEARKEVLEKYSLAAGAESLARALEPASTPAPMIQTVDGSRKPRVLLVNVYFPPQSIGGATRVVSGNIDDWLASGAQDTFDFGVAATDFGGEPAYRSRIDSYRSVPVFRISPPMVEDLDWRPQDAKMGAWFAGVLEQFKPDLVHFHSIQRLTTSIVETCAQADIPYLISVHDGWWLSDYQFLFDENGQMRTPGDELLLGGKKGVPLSATMSRLARLRKTLEGARYVLTPSRHFAELYRGAGYSNVLPIPNGLPNLSPQPRRPSGSGRVRLGHIGDTSPHKGFDLIEAALKQGRFPHLELMAISYGRQESQETSYIWGETPVRIRGRVPQDKVADLYANLDVLLAPSACTESYGLVTREAHAAGLWVVASDRGAIGEDVRDGVDGFIVDASTPVGVGDALRAINDDPQRFLESPPRRSDIRLASDQARELISLYDEVLNSEFKRR